MSRLIDADELLKHKTDHEYISTHLIYNAPTVDAIPAEPKTGHWIKIKPYPLQMHDYECSECGCETDDNTENYCSECGARMVEPQERSE